MKRLLVAATVVILLAGAAAFSARDGGLVAVLQLTVEDRNPWTHLRLNNNPDDFQFVFVSDRTGGHRARVFSRAVEQINLLQPEFVVSVGDLIEGGSENADKIAGEWREFQGYVARLQMPFFYVPGNHDISNLFQEKAWQEKFGRRYYHFVYKDVLFLLLCSEDPPKSNSLSAEQVAYVKKALDENKSVRWTIVALHKPIWTARDLEKNGWLEVEKALADRPYTVFCGHVHHYQKFVRNGRNYYQLATTGGSSRMRGLRYGEFDHVVWVTMKKDGPVLANILLDGVYPEDMKPIASDEEGVARQRLATQPVKGTAYCDGCPAAGATVVFHLVNPDGKPPTRAADGRVEGDGSFTLSTYTANDGVPAGDYVVTVIRDRFHPDQEGRPGLNLLPEKYARTDTTPLKVTVRPGPNVVTLDLKRDS